MLDLPIAGDGTDARPTRALDELRDELIPRDLGRVPGARRTSTGMTAGTQDFNDLMKAHAPLVFAFVLGAGVRAAALTFRSIVIPIKAIVLNLLSVGAAYGVLVWSSRTAT